MVELKSANYNITITSACQLTQTYDIQFPHLKIQTKHL